MSNVVKISWKSESQESLEALLADRKFGAFIFIAEDKENDIYEYVVGAHNDRAQSVGLLEMAKYDLIGRGDFIDD